MIREVEILLIFMLNYSSTFFSVRSVYYSICNMFVAAVDCLIYNTQKVSPVIQTGSTLKQSGISSEMTAGDIF